MFFFKQKKQDEIILPPPPPLPNTEMEYSLKFFDDAPEDFDEKFKKKNILAAKDKKIIKKEKKLQKSMPLAMQINLPEQPKSSAGKNFEFPETSEDSSIEDLDAEEEIKSAVEKMKKEEKVSFFRKIFPINQKINRDAQKYPAAQLKQADEISIIQNKIKKARESLAKLDLKSAKDNYLEIMKVYNSMKPEEQAKVYNDIKNLYAERKNTEEVKI